MSKRTEAEAAGMWHLAYVEKLCEVDSLRVLLVSVLKAFEDGDSTLIRIVIAEARAALRRGLQGDTSTVDLLAALRLAQEDTCSLHCPSVRKTDQEWAHSERCRAISAAIAKVETLSYYP